MQTNFTNRLALAMQIDPAVLWEHFPNGVTINDLQRVNEIPVSYTHLKCATIQLLVKIKGGSECGLH